MTEKNDEKNVLDRQEQSEQPEPPEQPYSIFSKRQRVLYV
jgi:hypothetical protein